ncbi:hypothetical protein DWB77_01220 [Streptomyces hundungensis]|uniref:Uncharacterized protein n=1 Tax=Streptomyces hundungensis TaxID=1077946 RepID=A0A387HDU1_9ACTN|nr:hypothetical protein DWB77_01220 [Streptomyces hundungensis]
MPAIIPPPRSASALLSVRCLSRMEEGEQPEAPLWAAGHGLRWVPAWPAPSTEPYTPLCPDHQA